MSLIISSHDVEDKKQLAARHRELSKVKNRIAEIDTLLEKNYEGNDRGKLTDEQRYAASQSYEDGEKLKAAAPEASIWKSKQIRPRACRVSFRRSRESQS